MRFLSALLILFASSASAWAWGPLSAPEPDYGDALILDIRSPDEFERGHVPGAVNFVFPIPKMDKWDKEKLAEVRANL